MITLTTTGREDLLEVSYAPPVTDDDYRKVLIPAIDAAIAGSERLRLLVNLDAGISDFTFGAMLEDMRTGMKHWRGFDRIAVVTESGPMAQTIRAFGVFMPCPVRTFPKERHDDALRWLEESLGTIHQTDLGNGVLHLQLIGQLDAKVYARETEDLNNFIRANDRFRLLLDIREFDGWQGLGGLAEHLKLVRDHASLLDRAAVVGNAGWQELAVQIGKRALGREARFFPAEEFEAAKGWLLKD